MKEVTIIDANGNSITRPMTPEEEANFEHDFQCELENDHADELED